MIKKNKHKILKLFGSVLTVYLCIAGAILFIFGKSDIVMKTADNYYDVNCNFMIISNGDIRLTDTKISEHQMKLTLAYSTLVNVDSDINNLYGDNLYVIEDYIYYYKNNSNKLYRYNINDYKIEEFDKSKYVNDEEIKTSIGTNTIASEAILNYYPEVAKYIDELNGYYNHQMYLDKDRIFFVVNNDLYEYHILRDRIRMVMYDIDENIEYLFVK